MRKAELDEMRAILRAQALAAPPPAPKGLLGGVKSLWKKSPAAAKRAPLNLTPPDLTPSAGPVAPELPADCAPPESATASVMLETDAPMLFLAPRRARFGLADEGARPVSEPRLSFKATPDAAEDFEFQPRRRGASLAATEAAGVGADEILELHEMLSERMPQLLSQIDLEAKLEQAPSQPADDEPSIAAVVASIEAARAGVERAAVREAWAEVAPPLSILHQDRTQAGAGRRRRLSRLHAELSSQHADLEGDLQAVKRARSRPMRRAA